jgi:hypothetical protein
VLLANDGLEIADIVMVGWLPRRITMEDMPFMEDMPTMVDPAFVFDAAIGSVESVLSATDQ